MPYLEQRQLYDSLNFDLPMPFSANATASQAAVAVFLCPSDSSPPPEGRTSYAGNRGWGFREGGKGICDNGSVSPRSPVAIRDISDGTSTTVLMSELLTGRPGGLIPKSGAKEFGVG
jgi:hypothetical protein